MTGGNRTIRMVAIMLSALALGAIGGVMIGAYAVSGVDPLRIAAYAPVVRPDRTNPRLPGPRDVAMQDTLFRGDGDHAPPGRTPPSTEPD